VIREQIRRQSLTHVFTLRHDYTIYRGLREKGLI